jgi:hypothetical protein
MIAAQFKALLEPVRGPSEVHYRDAENEYMYDWLIVLLKPKGRFRCELGYQLLEVGDTGVPQSYQ